jgi:tetratricopeptide (TPR) repeat protein
MNRRYLPWLVIALALLGHSSPARAQTDAQKKEAKSHYETASRLYDVGKYADAIEEYQKVYLLTDDPNMLYNIAQSYRLSDHPQEAARFYRSYLRRSPGASNRSDVERKIAEQERIIDERKRAGAPAGASPGATAPSQQVVVPPPPPPPEAVNPATNPPPAGAQPPPASASPGGGLPSPSVTPPPTTAEPPPAGGLAQSGAPTEAPPGSGMRTASYVLLIGGGVLLATSLISGAVASKKSKDLESLAKNGGVYDPGLQSSGKAANGVAIAAGLLGVAAAATGGILLYTSRGSSSPSASALPLRIALYPVAGPQLAGGGAVLSF